MPVQICGNSIIIMKDGHLILGGGGTETQTLVCQCLLNSAIINDFMVICVTSAHQLLQLYI
jgi:hypothetical protein